MDELPSVDGTIGPADAMTIPVTDEGLLRGDGVFEVAKLYGGRPFAWDEHLARLVRSAANLRLEFDLDAARAEVAALLDRAGAVDGTVRLLVTRGGRRVVVLAPLPATAPTVALATVEYAPSRVLDAVKSLSYAANMHASRLAREAGADEALLVTPEGRVLEGPTSPSPTRRSAASTAPSSPTSRRRSSPPPRARSSRSPPSTGGRCPPPPAHGRRRPPRPSGATSSASSPSRSAITAHSPGRTT